MNYWKYVLQLQIPGTEKRMEIEFLDSAGEFFDAGGKHHNETVSFIKDCDVFVVIVDTPYLMAGSKVEAEAANVIDSIHTFLMQIDSQNGRKAKQVLFVPIKCEKWVKEGRIDDVVKTIEEKYDATIRDLRASNKTEISIIQLKRLEILFLPSLKTHIFSIILKTTAKSDVPRLAIDLCCSLMGRTVRLWILRFLTMTLKEFSNLEKRCLI